MFTAPEQRITALRYIRHQGPAAADAAPIVIKMLKVASRNERIDPFGVPELVATLGSIGPSAKKAIPVLHKLLERVEGPENTSIWIETVAALLAIDSCDKLALNALASTAGKPEHAGKASGVIATAQARTLKAMLQSEMMPHHIVLDAAHILALRSPGDSDAAAAALTKLMNDGPLALHAAYRLISLPAPHSEPAVDFLKTRAVYGKDEDQRVAAASILAETKPEALGEDDVKNLSHVVKTAKKHGTRKSAMLAIAKLAPAEIDGILEEVMKGYPFTTPSENIALEDTLSALGPRAKSAIPRLISVYQTTRSNVSGTGTNDREEKPIGLCQRILAVLGEIGQTPESLQFVEEAQKDPNPIIQSSANSALLKLSRR